MRQLKKQTHIPAAGRRKKQENGCKKKGPAGKGGRTPGNMVFYVFYVKKTLDMY